MEVAVAQIHHGNIHPKLMGNRSSTDCSIGKDSPRYLRNLTNSAELLETIDSVESEELVAYPPSHNSSVRSTEETGGNRFAVRNVSENYENDCKENMICKTTEKVEDIHEDDFRVAECLSDDTSNMSGCSTGQFSSDQCTGGDLKTSKPSQNDLKKLLKKLTVPALSSDRELRTLCKTLKLKLNMPPCAKYFRNYTEAVNSLELPSTSKGRRHPDSDDSSVEDSSEYEVEAIRDYSYEKGEHWYLVKWKNWPDETNTWEPKHNLSGCAEILIEFHENLKRKRVVVADDDSPKSKKRKIHSCILEVCSRSSEDLATLLKLRGIPPGTFKFKKSNIAKLKKEVKQMYITAAETTKRKNLNKLLESESNLFGEDGLVGFAVKRRSLLTSLKEWEAELNNHYYNNFQIIVENHVDLEGPPENFTYITNYIPGEGITIPEDPLVGCCCGDCFANKDQCCAAGAGCEYAYDESGRVCVSSGSPIYECNKLCSCGPDCPNRVVQKGQKINVLIFRTDDGRGWGVKTLEHIKKGTFVMEYNGEVITNEEAERRGTLYDGEGRTYLFDLDYDESDPLTVDAAYYGNAAHFINHSCDPNLYVYGVWIEHLDTRIPRVAFFARKNIKKYEELTFDYRMTAGGPQTPKKTGVNGSPSKDLAISNEDYLRSASSSSRRKPIACRCGTAKCRKFLF